MKAIPTLEDKKAFAAQLRALAEKLENDVATDSGFIDIRNHTPTGFIDYVSGKSDVPFPIAYTEQTIRAEFTIFPDAKEWRRDI